jgi:hypothetical protein
MVGEPLISFGDVKHRGACWNVKHVLRRRTNFPGAAAQPLGSCRIFLVASNVHRQKLSTYDLGQLELWAIAPELGAIALDGPKAAD